MNSDFVKKLIRETSEKLQKLSKEELYELFTKGEDSDLKEIIETFLKEEK